MKSKIKTLATRSPDSEEEEMTAETNVDCIRRYFEVTDKGDEGATLAIIDELFAEDYVAHMAGATIERRETLKTHASASYTAFSEMEHRIEDNFGSGDKVTTRVLFRAIHSSDVFGIPATGRRIECPIIYVHRFAHGKIQEAWMDWDSVAVVVERLRASD